MARQLDGHPNGAADCLITTLQEKAAQLLHTSIGMDTRASSVASHIAAGGMGANVIEAANKRCKWQFVEQRAALAVCASYSWRS